MPRSLLVGLFRANKISFENDETSTRCGRCAHVLPDETLSFCPKCGVPFSKTPPTLSYHTLADRAHDLTLKKYRLRLITLSTIIFVSFWTLLGSFITLQNEALIAELQSVRGLNIYIIDDPQHPTLSPTIKMASIGHAIEKFKNHFGIEIQNIAIHHNKLPPEIAEPFPNFMSLEEKSSLSFWESEIYPALKMNWQSTASKPLSVLFTNMPIQNDLGAQSPIETSHLNPLGLVSGLGHPLLSVISSYRLLREEKLLIDKDSPLSRDFQLAHYIGEYVFAHELGHALLALPDFIATNHTPTFASLRGPASSQNIDYANCIMHTDSGGGYQAWQAIQNRQPQSLQSSPQICPEYTSVIKGFQLRSQALSALKTGEREVAQKLYEELLQSYNPESRTWLRAQWEQENLLLMSFIRRWWQQIFMIELSS